MKAKRTFLGAVLVAALTLWFANAPAPAQPFVNINAGLLEFGDQSSVAWGDYDNDGRLDILVMGLAATDPFPRPLTQIWRNTGSGFVEINAGLPGAYMASAAWGDYDNDGRLDIVLAGFDMTNRLAGVWRNTGTGFTNINAGLPGTQMGTVAWGDYDNDGRLDILQTGYTGSGYLAQVWRNTGSGFTNINAGLTGVAGPAAWGDYDNDGRLDILLTGITNFMGALAAQLWRNTGTGFTQVPIPGLPGASDSSVSWADYDNDGRLDFLLTGWDSHVVHYTQLWRNTGSGFTNVPIPGLQGLRDGSAAWGDYDNDGRLDLLLAGYPGPVAQVWRNTGTTFTNVPVSGLPGIGQCSLAWGDYNNDGRLDILLAGNDPSNRKVTQIWRNTAALANTAPAAPAGLTATAFNRGAVLSWNAPADAQTPAGGLTYNVRVGTSPGTWNILSPQGAPATNFLRVAALGNAQSGLTALIDNLPPGNYYWSVQAVDTAFAGSPFATEGQFGVYPPIVTTLPATDITSTSGLLRGRANPRERETVAWFEYGFTTKYGGVTAGFNLGNATSDVPYDDPLTGLLPWMTYHFRAAASNPVGTVFGDDATFRLPPPSLNRPSLPALSDITLAQGGSTSIVFSVSDADTPLDQLRVRARCNNPVLAPTIPVSGSGDTRSLTLAPDPSHAGSAVITVTVSDDSGPASRAFTLTVLPRSGDGQVHLADAQVVSAEAWRFRLVDEGTGFSNHTVEYLPDLSPTNAWAIATNVTDLGGGVFEVANGPSQHDAGFYRVKGFRLLRANFDSTELSLEEGDAAAGAVIVFNGPFTGMLNYTWTDTSGADHAGTVQVNGTTAVIPLPSPDNAVIGQLGYLTLRLEAGTGYALGGSTAGTVIIEENDADWQGAVQTPGGILGFELSILRTNGVLQGHIKSGDPGFFPTTGLTQLNFTETAFTAVATNVALTVLPGSPSLSFTNYLDLRLDALNSSGQTNVNPTEIHGAATLVSRVLNRPYLDAAVSGTFVLMKPSTAPSTNEVPLTPSP